MEKNWNLSNTKAFLFWVEYWRNGALETHGFREFGAYS